MDGMVPPPPVQPRGKAENPPREIQGVRARCDTGCVRATEPVRGGIPGVCVRLACVRRDLFFGHFERHKK